MTQRQACIVLLARDEGSWKVLLERTVDVYGAYGWQFPGTPLNDSHTAERLIAQAFTRSLGMRVHATELLPLGWYGLTDWHGSPVYVSASTTIFPELNDALINVPDDLAWWPLRSLTASAANVIHHPLHQEIANDVSRIAPSDDTSESAVISMRKHHLPSLRSLLHSVRERTGGVTPAAWSSALSDLDSTHIEPGGDFLVAALNDFVTGMCGVHPVSDDVAELTWLLVHPRWRDRGLGEHLVAAAEARAATLGFTQMVLNTSQLFNPAEQLVNRCGYRWAEATTEGAMYAASKDISRSAAPVR